VLTLLFGRLSIILDSKGKKVVSDLQHRRVVDEIHSNGHAPLLSSRDASNLETRQSECKVINGVV
jgi:hypothetical protein